MGQHVRPTRKKGGSEGQLVLLYVPCGSDEEAASIARTLLAERLIACGNLYQSRSIYNWEGRTLDETECLLICKTVRSRVAAAERRIAELHSYQIPCIVRVNSEHVNRAYEAWVLEQLIAPASGPVSLEAEQITAGLSPAGE